MILRSILDNSSRGCGTLGYELAIWFWFNLFAALGTSLMWALLCLSSLPVAVVTTTLRSFIFYISLKQQNLFKIQSKWSEFFKSTSCVLGHIKILMMHFLHFVCVKMHNFCVNTISAIYITMVGCDWCISILTVPVRSCSLSSPLLYRSPVVFLDRGYPRFGIAELKFPKRGCPR